MNLSRFFSKQAGKPSGLFGRIVMPVIFDLGNAFFNNYVNELIDIQPDERVLEIGCGTGKLTGLMAEKIETGRIEGVDVSSEMVKIAQKKNKRQIANGIVNIVHADFNAYKVADASFTKACSVNTIYFWTKPEETIKKVFCLLNPGGLFIIAFEDRGQLEQRNLSKDVFRIYSKNEVKKLLVHGGFTREVQIESIEKQKLCFHCAVARKHSQTNRKVIKAFQYDP